MTIVRYNDPTSGRPQVADELTPTTPTNTVVGAAGSAIAQMMIDNVADATSISALQTVVDQFHGQYMVFEGVADWNGTSGTDNGTAFHNIITAAIAQSGHTTVVIPHGRYYVGTTNRSYYLTSGLTLLGIGDVEIAGGAGTSILSFNGELTGYEPRSALALSGDHNRTPRVGLDGYTYYDGFTTVTTTTDHDASIGEEIHLLQDSVQWGSGNGGVTYHISRVIATPTSSTITMAHPTLWNFAAATTTVWCPRFNGPLHVKNIKWTQTNVTNDSSCIRCYRISNSSIEDCEFYGTNLPVGIADAVLVSDCMNWRIERSKFQKWRYGVIVNRTRNIYAKTNEINDCRHFISPGYGTYGVYVDHAWGRENTCIIDAHEAINCTFKNIVDEGGYAGPTKNDMFNCRALGFTLENIYWEGYADGVGNKNIYLGINSTFDDTYSDLLRRFPINIRNVSFHSRTDATTSIRRAGIVNIDGLSLSGGDTLEIGNSDEGVQVVNGLESVTGYQGAIRLFKVGGDDADLERFSGTITSATATTATLPTSTAESSATEDFHIGSLIQITGGTGSGQNRRITDYTVVGGGGSDHIITVDTWDTTPDNTSTYEINCTNFQCGDLLASVATQWGVVRKQLSTQAVGGDTDLYPYRIRIWPIVTGDLPTRYESVIFELRATTNAGIEPGYSMWKWLIDYKSIPGRLIDGPYLLDQTPQRNGRLMTATISDIVVDPSATAAPGWFEFTITVTTEESNTSLYGMAESIGTN